jgi:hypothetical protein
MTKQYTMPDRFCLFSGESVGSSTGSRNIKLHTETTNKVLLFVVCFPCPPDRRSVVAEV